MKIKAAIVLASVFLLTFSACRKDSSVPELTTLSVQNNAYFTANCGGIVNDDGGLEITHRGVCWSTNPNPTINDDTTINMGERSHFVAFLQDLLPNTTYYVRAYAINSAGTGYGQEISFSTQKGSLAEVLTFEPEELFSIIAKVSGEVVSDGELKITERGFCWNIEPQPTPDHFKKTVSGEIGLFEANIQGLTPGTTYYMRAYAINNAGVAFGNQIIVTTPSPEPEPIVVAGEVEILSYWNVLVPVAINSSQSLPVTGRGICWSTSPNPTVHDHVSISPYMKDTFSLEINLIHNTTYYLRAYAKTSISITYGNQLVFSTPDLGLPCDGHETVTDIDGNVYNTVQLGNFMLDERES